MHFCMQHDAPHLAQAIIIVLALMLLLLLFVTHRPVLIAAAIMIYCSMRSIYAALAGCPSLMPVVSL